MRARTGADRLRSGLVLAVALVLLLVASLPASAAASPAPPGERPPGTGPASAPTMIAAGAEEGAPAGPVHAAVVSNAFLYRVKLAVERIRLWLTRSVRGQTEYLIRLIDRRSSEIAEMIRTGRTKLVETAARDQERLIRQVEDRVGAMELAEEEDIGLLERVEQAVGRAWNTLSAAVSHLPEKARGAVRGVIDSMSRRAAQFWHRVEDALSRTHGSGAAKGLLDRIRRQHSPQDGQPPGGPPEGNGPPEGKVTHGK